MSVETGVGTPTVSVLNDVNAKVSMRVAGLKYPVYGFVGGVNRELLQVLMDAQKNGELIEYRIESRRKGSVDPLTPFAELDHKSECVRLFACANGVWSTEVTPNAAVPITTSQPHTGLTRLHELMHTNPDRALVTATAAAFIALTTIPVTDILAATTPQPTTPQPTTPQPTAPLATPDDLSRLRVLTRLAGVSENHTNSFLTTRYGVSTPNELSHDAISALLAFYRSLGASEGPRAFAVDCGAALV
jgi:hypothetical protein